MKRHLALSAIGRDRPGIVAAVADVLLTHAGNVEDSQMTILRDHFTMTLVVALPEDADVDRLREDLDRVRSELDLEAVALTPIEEGAPSGASSSHILSIYGVDHPGILQAVAAVLAADQVNICDLTTRVLDAESDQPIYAMIIEVALPEDGDVAQLERKLADVCTAQHVELSLRELESDTL
jgi:glycine cleavage system transcriptional repressor